VFILQYRAMTDEDLLEAAKNERCSPDLVKALAERLEDVLAEAAAFTTVPPINELSTEEET